MRSLITKNNMNKTVFVIIFLCAGWCVAGDAGGSKFSLNIGAGGEYILALKYQNQFDSTTSYSSSSKNAITPSLNIGMAVNSRLSHFMHYSHFLIYDDQSYEKLQLVSYTALACMVVPSEKFSQIYLSYSWGYLFIWWPIEYYEAGLRGYGWATTASCGYRVNNHCRVQLDMDYLAYGIGGSINRTTIDPNDNSNTIRNLGTASFGDNLFNIIIGLSAYWDIF
jgi:hypothetical protein